VVENPLPNQTLSGKVTVSGWAYDPDGRIVAARVLIDGSTFLNLQYGIKRDDACAALPDAKACPNVGFTGEVDTTLLSNGLHSLAVSLSDDSGGTVNIPLIGRSGMNVFVDNK
jgi:hypothetical protein